MIPGHRVPGALGVLALAGALALPLPAAAAAPTADVPATNSASVALAGPVSPAAPDARAVTTITVPLTVRNTSNETLYDVRITSLRSAPITSTSSLDEAFRGARIETSTATQDGPTLEVAAPIAPGASATINYVADSSADRGTGICLCFLGVYALDLNVSAASSPDGRRGSVGRTQTYLPSLTDNQQVRADVGWLWPLLDRPHRAVDGPVFTDDQLATSVAAGGRLDRALQAIETVDATDPAAATGVLLLIDPELLAELHTMATGYRVTQPDGSTVAGAGGPAASEWLTRLAAVLPHHDTRFTLPADPDVVGLATNGLTPSTPALAGTTATAVAAGLGLTDLPAHDLAWPAGAVDAAGLGAVAQSGATALVEPGSAIAAGSLADTAVDTAGGAPGPTPALIGDRGVQAEAAAAIGAGGDTSAGLQRLVVSTAMTGVLNPDDAKYVLVTTPRDLDVDPAAAARAIAATTSLGTPRSPLSALGDSLAEAPTVPLTASESPSPVADALRAAATATTAAATLRSAAAGTGVDDLVGDLGARIQRATSLSWPVDPAGYAASTQALNALGTTWQHGVGVVVSTNNNYSLASEDAPLLLTVANSLPIDMQLRVDAAAVGDAQGFRAAVGDVVTVPAGSRKTVSVPTTVTRSGRFAVAVTLHSPSGAPLGPPVQLNVTSTAVGAVGQIVTYGAGVLLVLALLVRGVRRLRRRGRAGSDGTSDAPQEAPTVPAAP